MVAFKEEFPYLRCESGQLFEFNQQWLRAAITRAADQAGYPSWWLTDHITESIAFYLRLRNDEPVVPFSQLSQTVRYVLKVIGYKEIIPYFTRRLRRSLSRCSRSRKLRARATSWRFSMGWRNGSMRSSRPARTACSLSGCRRASNICAERKPGRALAILCARK